MIVAPHCALPPEGIAMNFQPGSFEVGPLMITLSEKAIATMRPYTGPQWPASGAAPDAAPAPAPTSLRISPAPDTAPSAPAASLAADQPDYCAPGFQESLWLKKGSLTRQEGDGATNAPKPGLSLAALERLRS